MGCAAALAGCGAEDGGGTLVTPPGDAAPLVAALGARLADGAALAAPAPPVWPLDLDFHPDARGESIELLAALRDGDGRRYSFTRRFDRFALGRAGAGTVVSGEDFAFAEVVRLVGGLDEEHGDADAAGEPAFAGPPSVGPRREVLERMTLGLAATDAREMRVRDATLALERPPGASAPCALDHALVEGDGLALRFRQRRCPSAMLAGGLAIATSPTLAVDGRLVVAGRTRAVTGSGWVRRVWGDVGALGGGAVVFDRLLLELDGVGLVEAARSKRRSGRGPMTVTASVRTAREDAAGGRAAAVAAPSLGGTIDWVDATDGAGEADAGAGEVPAAWTLRAAEVGVDVVLEPLLESAVTADALGRTWRGAVTARGSHEGLGFVEFVPLGTPAVTP